MSEDRDQRWPADDPWYRFTPRNLVVGYLSLIAAGICLGLSILNLMDEHTGTRGMVFYALFGAVAVFWLFRSANGIKALLRRRAGR
jgi:SNF family Na+-dependent transporter